MARVGLRGDNRAERVDSQTGVREIAEFTGGPVPMLRFMHLPPGEVRGAVVICSSVYAEFMKNYRREVRLARSLASAGFAAVRIQYRGTGNSAGDPGFVSLSALVADVAETVGDLDNSFGSPAYVGTRIGALVAALAAPPESPLAMWEPVLNGERWLKEGIRAATISSVSRQITDELQDVKSSVAQFESEGVLDLLGFALYRSLVDDIRRTQIESVLADRIGPMFVMQIGGGSVPKPVFAQLIDRLRAKGADIEAKAAGRDVAWWFEDGGARDFETDDEVIGATIAWLGKAFVTR